MFFYFTKPIFCGFLKLKIILRRAEKRTKISYSSDSQDTSQTNITLLCRLFNFEGLFRGWLNEKDTHRAQVLSTKF